MFHVKQEASLVYLDNAATSWPKPAQVNTAPGEFMASAGANPGRSGHALSLQAARRMFRVRRQVAEMFHVGDPARVIFTPGATYSLNLALKGLLASGDRVLLSPLEHNSVLRPLHSLSRQGVAMEVLRADREGYIDPDELSAALGQKTRLLVISHASNVTGTLQPLKELAALAREAGCLTLVDASQTAGVVEIDMSRDHIDLLAFPAHKAMYGWPGLGCLCLREDLLPVPQWQGGTGSNSLSLEQPSDLPDRLEAGTINLPGVIALGEGINFVTEQGLDHIYRHELGLIEQLVTDLVDLQLAQVYGPAAGKPRVGVAAFNIPGIDPGEAAFLLDSLYHIALRPGYHCAPLAHRHIGTESTGALRASLGAFNTRNDTERLLSALKEIRNNIRS